MRKDDSMAWPSLLWLHGLGFLLLLGLTLGLGRRKEYAMVLVLLAASWTMFVVIRKWRQDSLPKGLLPLDWLFLAFVALICLSFALQGWGKPWVQANARLVPFYMAAAYLCGRLMLENDLKLFAQYLFILLGVSLLIFLLAFGVVEDSYLQYRPQVAGTDEITARIANLLAPVTIVVAFFLLRDFGTCRARGIWGYFLLLGGLAALLVFMGLKALVLSSSCVIAVGCLKAKWLSPQRRLSVAIFFALVVALTSAVLYQTNSLANKNGNEVVGAVARLADDGAGTPEGCSENLKKYNSVAIRLELFRDALQQFRSSPLVGVGAGAFGQQSCWSSTMAHPHNILMQAAAELGLIGVSILMAMALLAAIPQLRLSWSPTGIRSLSSLLFLLAVLNALSSGNYFTSSELWWSLGLVASMNPQIAPFRKKAVGHVS